MAKLKVKSKHANLLINILITGVLMGGIFFFVIAQAEEIVDIEDPIRYYFDVKTATLADIQELLAMGIDINSRDENGETLLPGALLAGRSEIAIFLIEEGADVNIKSYWEYTPLHWARDAEIVKLLLSAGADANARNRINGETPLHNTENAEITKLLLDAGADVNARDDDGETPFFKAVHGKYVHQIYDREKHYIECSEGGGCSEDEQYEPTSNVTYEETIAMIDILIEYGADVKAKNKKGNFANFDFFDNYLIKIGVLSNY